MSDINNSSVEEVLENENPSFRSKLIHFWVLPAIYAIALGSIILIFTGVSFHSQFNWVKDHTKGLRVITAKTVELVTSKNEKSSTDKKKTSVASGKNANSKTTKTTKDTSSETKQNSTNQESTALNGSTTAADSLSSMDPRVAAKLLSNMNEVNALKVFKQLKVEVQSAIIAEMPSDQGARMTAALTSEDEPATTTTTASQLYQFMQPEQIATVLNGIKNNEQILSQIRQMDPNTASKVISKLNPDVAGWIVTHLNP